MEKTTFTYKPDGEMECMGNKITNVHIFKPGEYRGNKWTKAVVEKMVENFRILKEKTGFEPPVRIGHRGDNSVENANATIGYIEDLKTDENGNMFADMDIADEKGYEDIKSKKLKNRSIEIGPYETNEGDEFDNVVWGVGWVDIPQVEGLAEAIIYSKPLMEEKMEKEEVKKESTEKKVEDKEESKDSAEETSKGEDEKVKLDKEEADDDEEEEKEDESEDKESDEDKSEDMDKKAEMVSMSKEEVADLKAAKEKLDKIEVKNAEIKIVSRAEKVDAFHKEGKVLPAMLDKEKEFAQSLSDEQYDKYVEIKGSTPKLVELGKESGSQTSNEPDKDTDTQKLEKVTQKADELVADSLIRQGYSKEEVDKLLESKK